MFSAPGTWSGNQFAGSGPKSPPAAVLLKKAAKIKKGSGEPNRNKVGTVTKAQLLEIVEMKKDDLNAHDPEQALKIIAGTARSMGLEVEG